MSIIQLMENFGESNLYGLVIIFISIITRIFVVSIAWSYGAFLVALKKAYPDSYFTELGWIAGIAQGLGSVISPAYMLISNKIGIRTTFLIGLILCFLSLLASSYVTSEHALFFTYSLPFGIGSSIVFVLGSLLTGTYFPPGHKFHITATVAISLGFPLGFLVLNPLTDVLMKRYGDWQYVQRIYSGITLILALTCGPFFTEKKSQKQEEEAATKSENVYRNNFYFLKPEHLAIVVKVFWLGGIVLLSCANNSILMNLNGFFNAQGFNSTSLHSKYLALGVSDTFYRIVLSGIGFLLVENLSICYIASAFVGMMLSVAWTSQDSSYMNTLFSMLYGFCPAVLMSLMYSVSSEISGASNIKKEYTLNVMFSGFGIILGPVLSGYLLDQNKSNYDSVFILATVLYAISLILFLCMKAILVKNKMNNKEDGLSKTDYIEFENENETNIIEN